ncbi:MAG: nucleoside triphosphate pyrophosphohydrolase [Candidatus Yanofskybacteria bacterium]|nr:nucleoside triphosphate pyrophosphohydrolase [Candidatus Yanofskybacteria bacterium]
MTKYNKLIRDKIPEIIEKKGGKAITHIADEAEYAAKLREKLQEEVDEFIKDQNLEEIADVVEVLEALAQQLGGSWDQVREIQHKKADERGKFEKKIILEES